PQRYTLSLHDALPISARASQARPVLAHRFGMQLGLTPTHLDAIFYDEDWNPLPRPVRQPRQELAVRRTANDRGKAARQRCRSESDRKSTRLNSSHGSI